LVAPKTASLKHRVRSFLGLLASNPILKDLTQSQCEALVDHLELKEVEKGAVIVQEGVVGNEAFFLAQGEVEIFETMTLKTSRLGFEDKERTLLHLDAGMGVFIGELALFEDAHRSANVVATTPCVLLVLERAEFDAFISADPDAGAKILQAIGKVLVGRILKLTSDVKKLTTALSIAVR
jgi:ATP-binding cassette subfamily B protein